ncbi:Decarboxylase NovR [Pigmentiphaga humi]|uniref:Decarboxylase NovR n=1 Tax=Pigmentiphaga humi TaxID=2478468 RepID=A0A3P4B674_9BURK|nr:class II aldolase/adducin family protein [Pigmentiphaga humi]VCU71789.1 Decarboxylase NovR [Pigmentiphaga humi]
MNAPDQQPRMLLEVRPEGLTIPEPPRFDDPQAERLHRKQRLAACLRIFSMHGFDAGIAGHISCRDAVRPDHFWVNPLALHFSRVKVSDLVLVDHEGRIVEGRHPVNAAAFSIHSRIHRARPEVMAAAHSHSLYGTTYASLGKPIPPISQEACAFYQDHAVMQAYNGIAAELSEGEAIASALGPAKAVICRNHGLFTVGQTVEEAVFWFLRMERACEQTLRATAAGQPVEVDEATALMTRKQVGAPKAGWFGLQPLVDKVLAEQPDLLD